MLLEKRMTPKTPHPPSRGPRKGQTRRIHIPVVLATDPQALQMRNLMAARRRVDNAYRKLYEASVLLADAPDEISPLAREDVKAATQLAQRATRQLRLRRGRKPSAKKADSSTSSAHLERGSDAPPEGPLPLSGVS
jgi:hypothetical protein